MQTIDETNSTPTIYVPLYTLPRCRTCSFFISEDWVNGMCFKFGGERSADDYCSNGAWLSNATD